MHSLRSIPYPPTRLQARPTRKPIQFLCLAPDADQVCLTGDFNQWHPSSLPMTRGVDGAWRLSLPLGHGSHQYQFLVDGRPINDERAHGIARNQHGDRVSLVLVS